MGKITNATEIAIEKLKPYEKNAKKHPPEQVKKIARSIEEFGFLSPVLIDKDDRIIAGHGRVLAAKQIGLESVPCVYVEGLTDAQRRAYILADNRLGEITDWDTDMLNMELSDLDALDFDVSITGFDLPGERKTEYTGKTLVPQYEPTGEAVDEYDLVDLTKVEALREEIEQAAIPDAAKQFLSVAAWRHAVFDYRRIAEYYAQAPKEVQVLMEKSALVIIDIQDAIANGYLKLSASIEKILGGAERG